MKFLIVLSLVVATTLAISQTSLHQKWADFKAQHEKQYNDPVEEIYRMAIFNENLAKIEEHNINYEKGVVTYSKAINQFADMTGKEFLDYVNKGKATRPEKNETLRLEWVEFKQPAAAAVDWRRNAVTEVKNQGQCGSCWSFATTGAIEGQLALKTGRMISLSEQNLMDCSGAYGNAACDGGWTDSAFEYIHDYGIMSEYAYPYEAQIDYCRFNPSQSITNLRGYYDLPSGNENSLLNAVANSGPVAVAIEATEELQFYSGGIFYDTTCSGSSNDLNHAVLTVGYGSEGGYDYWIIKNSWGTGWGEAGYYRGIRNYGNNCGIATAASYPVL